MEGLVLVLGELLFLLFAGLAIAVGQIVLFVIGGILELAFYFATGSWKAKGERKPKKLSVAATARIKSVLKIFLWVAGGLSAIIVALVFLLNSVWFEPSFRWLVGQVEKRSGIALAFEEVQGSYLSGQISLSRIHAHRKNHDRLKFDTSVDRLTVHFEPLQILAKPVKLKSLRVDGVEGNVERYQPDDEPRKESDADFTIEFNLKPRRAFVIQNLHISNAHIHVIDRMGSDDRLEADLVLDDLSSSPFRGRYAVFDILFRSSATGSVGEAPFELKTSRIDGGRSTIWKIHELPISIPRHFVGGFFKHINEGTLDVDVVDRWSLGGETDIDMDWSITFRNVKAELPEGLSALESKIVGTAVDYVNENGDELPLAFSLTINEHEFEGSASLKAAGLYKAITEAVLEELAAHAGFSKEEIKEKVSSGFDKVKKFIDWKRKKPAETE